MEACCRDIETGKSAQLIVDKKETARSFGQRERYFNAEWYKNREWLILCKTTKRAFCEICKFAADKRLVTFSKCGDDTFVNTGCNNWKKCPSLLDSHEKSNVHRECVQKKCAFFSQTPVNIQLVQQERIEQEKRRDGMMEQLRCLQFLTRQGLAIRGHEDKESNFKRLVELVADKNPTLRSFMLTGKYASHETINELINQMYRESLTTLLTEIKNNAEHYAVIVDETRDCSGHEQLSLTVRWVSADYVVHEECMTVLRLTHYQ